jgi:hypothetical protein
LSGSVGRRPGTSHAAPIRATASAADAFISAMRTESLNVNGIV